MKMLRGIAIGFMMVLFVVMLGCSSIQNGIIPCNIDPANGEYAGEKMTSWMPWTTIWDSDRLAAKMKFLHEANLIELERAAEDDTRYYGFLKDAMILDRGNATEFRDAVFSPKGPGGMLASALLPFGLGAFLITKPGDKKKIKELENGKKV